MDDVRTAGERSQALKQTPDTAGDVTVVLTSCGRQDLLERTLDSFFLHNTYPIRDFIVIEDGDGTKNDHLRSKYQKYAVTWLATGERVGQVAAIDRAYAGVKTDFIFHCEDDWEFLRPRFIERSIVVLNSRPDILMVSLRDKDDQNGYPVSDRVYFAEWVPYRLMHESYNAGKWGTWYGFAWNPGLRRRRDYELLGSFGSLDPLHTTPAWQVEREAGAFYRKHGFATALLAEDCGPGYVRHIGDDRHIQELKGLANPEGPSVNVDQLMLPAGLKMDNGEVTEKCIESGARATPVMSVGALTASVAVSQAEEDPIALRDRIIEAAVRELRDCQVEAAVKILGELEFATIDENTLRLTDPLLYNGIAHGRNIVASFDPHRVPSHDEVVIIYGNYPHSFQNLVNNNPIKRHVSDFWSFRHDAVESDERWLPIDQIFVINSDTRVDRYDAVLRELASARAPFHKITRIPARLHDDPALPPYVNGTIGCLESHLEATRRALAQGYTHTFIMEDDFCFTSDLETHLNDLQLFFKRGYAYWICLLGGSKYGRVMAKDDLVCLSFQTCTNGEAYLLSREGLDRVIPVHEAGLAGLKATGDVARFALDRYWSVLQDSGRFLAFRRKFGFQSAGLSDIQGVIVRPLD